MTTHELTLPAGFGASSLPGIYSGSLKVSTGNDGQLMLKVFPLTAIVCSDEDQISTDSAHWPEDNALVLEPNSQSDKSVTDVYRYDLSKAFSVRFLSSLASKEEYQKSCARLTFQLCKTEDCSVAFTSSFVRLANFDEEIVGRSTETPVLRQDLVLKTDAAFDRMDFTIRVTNMGLIEKSIQVKTVVCGSHILALH
mmetsp:Transcript_30184/g.46150  ORF Transcript_30184/g.46150 Transcript_30184/m.46150 type:complete len:196 (-) Transcript_30184:5522-6109(-)